MTSAVQTGLRFPRALAALALPDGTSLLVSGHDHAIIRLWDLAPVADLATELT